MKTRAAVVALIAVVVLVVLVISVAGYGRTTVDEHCDAADLRAQESECGYWDADGVWVLYPWVRPKFGGKPPKGVKPTPPRDAFRNKAPANPGAVKPAVKPADPGPARPVAPRRRP